MRKLNLVFLLSFIAGFLQAQEHVLPVAGELTAKLGWTLQDAIENFGYPQHVFAHRGESPEEDNSVFYYDDHRYLFFFQDRVWQIRADERWIGVIDGVQMGMSLEAVEKLWGPPINRIDDDPTWTLPDRGYPVRIKLYFEEDRLIDIYVYRGDW